MGRQVRRVPACWQHPRRANGGFVPLLDGMTFDQRLADWREQAAQWQRGFRRSWPGEPAWVLRRCGDVATIEQLIGPEPDPAHYMPRWPAELCTHLMMYETTTAGTPLSPAFAEDEHLALWLERNRVPLFAATTVPFSTWMVIIRGDLGAVSVLPPGAAA